MTRYELIERHGRALQECAAAGVSVHDWKNAEVYRFVQDLKGKGDKVDYCVRTAADRFAISEATVWRILRSMEQPVTITV